QGRNVTVLEVLQAASKELASASGPGGRLEHQPAVSAAIGRTLGNTFLAIGQSEPAARHLRDSVALHEKLYGPDHERTILAIADLAHALFEEDELAEAEALNRRALARLRELRGDADVETLSVA